MCPLQLYADNIALAVVPQCVFENFLGRDFYMSSKSIFKSLSNRLFVKLSNLIWELPGKDLGMKPPKCIQFLPAQTGTGLCVHVHSEMSLANITQCLHTCPKSALRSWPSPSDREGSKRQVPRHETTSRLCYCPRGGLRDTTPSSATSRAILSVILELFLCLGSL